MWAVFIRVYSRLYCLFLVFVGLNLSGCGRPDFSLTKEKVVRYVGPSNSGDVAGEAAQPIRLKGTLPTTENSEGSFVLYPEHPRLALYNYVHEVGELDCQGVAAGGGAHRPLTEAIVIKPSQDGTQHLCVFGVDEEGGSVPFFSYMWEFERGLPSLVLKGVGASGSRVGHWLKLWVDSRNSDFYQYQVVGQEVGCEAVSFEKNVSDLDAPIFLEGDDTLLKGRLCVRAGTGAVLSDVVTYDWFFDPSSLRMGLSSLPKDGEFLTEDLEVSLVNQEGVVAYSYVTSDGFLDCQNQDYVQRYLPDTPFTVKASHYSGFRTFCLVGFDSSDTPSPIYHYSWLQKGYLGDLLVAGLPDEETLDDSLNITVAGEGVLRYRYSLLHQQAADCSQTTMSGPIDITEPLNVAVGLGHKTLCLVGEGEDELPTKYFRFGFRRIHKAEPTLRLSSFRWPRLVRGLGEIVIAPRGDNVVSYRWGITSPTDACRFQEESPLNEATVVGDVIGDDSIADGDYKLCIQGKSLSGALTSPYIHDFSYDSTPPVIEAVSLPPELSDNRDVSIPLSMDDPEGEVAYILFPSLSNCDPQGVSLEFEANTGVLEFRAFEGQQVLCIWARDKAGNISDEIRHVFTVDTVPPANNRRRR